jgi:hypothetical protein
MHMDGGEMGMDVRVDVVNRTKMPYLTTTPTT